MTVSPAELVQQQIEAVLPPTYYAHLPAVERVKMLIEAWSLAMQVNAKQQDLLDALTTPNVSYFDMTPAEEIAQLEARLQEGQSVLKRRCEECDRYRAALEWIAGKENHAAGLEINSRLRAKIALDPNPTR